MTPGPSVVPSASSELTAITRWTVHEEGATEMKTLASILAVATAATFMVPDVTRRPVWQPQSTGTCSTAPVPSVLGRDAKDSARILTSRGFRNVKYVVQKGGLTVITVTTQIPAPGVPANRCDLVWLSLGE